MVGPGWRPDRQQTTHGLSRDGLQLAVTELAHRLISGRRSPVWSPVRSRGPAGGRQQLPGGHHGQGGSGSDHPAGPAAPSPTVTILTGGSSNAAKHRRGAQVRGLQQRTAVSDRRTTRDPGCRRGRRGAASAGTSGRDSADWVAGCGARRARWRPRARNPAEPARRRLLSRHRFPASGRRSGEAVAALAGPLNQGRLLQLAKPIIDPGLLAAGAACCHGACGIDLNVLARRSMPQGAGGPDR